MSNNSSLYCLVILCYAALSACQTSQELKTDTSTKPINGIIKTGAPIDIKAKGENSTKIIISDFESEGYITSNISTNESVRFGNNETEW